MAVSKSLDSILSGYDLGDMDYLHSTLNYFGVTGYNHKKFLHVMEKVPYGKGKSKEHLREHIKFIEESFEQPFHPLTIQASLEIILSNFLHKAYVEKDLGDVRAVFPFKTEFEKFLSVLALIELGQFFNSTYLFHYIHTNGENTGFLDNEKVADVPFMTFVTAHYLNVVEDGVFATKYEKIGSLTSLAAFTMSWTDKKGEWIASMEESLIHTRNIVKELQGLIKDDTFKDTFQKFYSRYAAVIPNGSSVAYRVKGSDVGYAHLLDPYLEP